MDFRNNIKVSVILAVYNAEKFLEKCLDSIIGQSLKNLEIICINDGSTDASLAILEAYEKRDGRIRIFTKENEGLGGASARNLGLEKVRGEYVSILDSDDFFDLSMLEKAARRADETQADVVVFGGCEYDQATGVSYPAGSILNVNALPEEEVFSYRDCPKNIFQISAGMAWNKLYRASFLKQYGLRFQRIKYTDDAYFTFAHMVLAKRITILKEQLCYYRVNSGTNQTAGLSNYPDSSYLPYLELKNSLVKWGCYDEVKQSFVNCAVAFMRYFHDRIDRYEAFDYLHDKFCTTVFPALDIEKLPKEYFYHDRSWLWCRQILENSSGELAFKSAHAYSPESTTGILRFLFPYDKVPRNSRVVIVGARVMARHYYAQMVLNGYCNVVACVSHENPFQLSYVKKMETLRGIPFDYAVVAYAEEYLVNPAVDFLKEMGIADDRIILGGNIL